MYSLIIAYNVEMDVIQYYFDFTLSIILVSLGHPMQVPTIPSVFGLRL